MYRYIAITIVLVLTACAIIPADTPNPTTADKDNPGFSRGTKGESTPAPDRGRPR